MSGKGCEAEAVGGEGGMERTGPEALAAGLLPRVTDEDVLPSIKTESHCGCCDGHAWLST